LAFFFIGRNCPQIGIENEKMKWFFIFPITKVPTRAPKQGGKKKRERHKPPKCGSQLPKNSQKKKEGCL
jgi:hypothetical protein